MHTRLKHSGIRHFTLQCAEETQHQTWTEVSYPSHSEREIGNTLY